MWSSTGFWGLYSAHTNTGVTMVHSDGGSVRNDAGWQEGCLSNPPRLHGVEHTVEALENSSYPVCVLLTSKSLPAFGCSLMFYPLFPFPERVWAAALCSDPLAECEFCSSQGNVMNNQPKQPWKAAPATSGSLPAGKPVYKTLWRLNTVKGLVICYGWARAGEETVFMAYVICYELFSRLCFWQWNQLSCEINFHRSFPTWYI